MGNLLPECINDICVLVPYQGQGQRSTSRSLHSKIVKTFLVLTFHFHDLYCDAILRANPDWKPIDPIRKIIHTRSSDFRQTKKPSGNDHPLLQIFRVHYNYLCYISHHGPASLWSWNPGQWGSWSGKSVWVHNTYLLMAFLMTAGFFSSGFSLIFLRNCLCSLAADIKASFDM